MYRKDYTKEPSGSRVINFKLNINGSSILIKFVVFTLSFDYYIHTFDPHAFTSSSLLSVQSSCPSQMYLFRMHRLLVHINWSPVQW